MPDSPTPQPESDFVCDCDESFRSACAGIPFYKEHEGKRYCALHFPGKEKSVDFKVALEKKLENGDFNFRGVCFPYSISFNRPLPKADFGSVTFCGNADFSDVDFGYIVGFASTVFCGKANFERTSVGLACFGESQFRGHAIFSGATFHKAEFESARFCALVDFSHAQLGDETAGPLSGEVEFTHARFDSLANFRKTQFLGRADFMFGVFEAMADFHGAKFQESARFLWTSFNDGAEFGFEVEGEKSFKSDLELEFCNIRKPEQIRFTNVTLRPSSFVNASARKFEFRNVRWDWKSDKILTPRERHHLRDAPPGRLTDRRALDRSARWEDSSLSAAYRDLALNAEENHRYYEASTFRYLSMDVRRRASWLGFAPWRLSWWYWVASGYGERKVQALVVLLGIWLVSGVLYTRVGFARWEPRLASEAEVATAKKDEVGAPLRFSRALSYSAGVMTLQKPEPKPATWAAHAIVLLETILGPVQAALLALAIRRKFMR